MQLNHEIVGEGPPLIILHGLFGSLENWRAAAREMGARHFTVHSLDLRNHGNSPHSDDFSYEVMAEDVKEYADQQGLGSFCLLGHSLGGKVAMHLALDAPERVDKLVVVDIAPKAYAPQHFEILEALLSLHPERFTERREMDRALAVQIPDAGTRLFLLKNAVPDQNGRFGWRLNLPAIARNYGELIKVIGDGRSFGGPTLFVKGQRSEYILPEDLQLITTLFPAARLATVANAGHWVHAENLPAFLHSVIDFLQK